jgi:NADH:ubiquinone oxidoreductase subunit 6 (subunit J)
MSVEQVVFALAGAACIVGSVVAVTHRDPRAAGAALMVTLISLAVLYAELAAPAVAAIVVVAALFLTVPLAVHLTVPAARIHGLDGPVVAGAALIIGAALLAILVAAVSLGEVPVNVSTRSSDGYDMGALRDLFAGRSAAAAGGSVILLMATAVAARAARRHRQAP